MYFGTQIFINNKKVFKFGKEEIDIERAENLDATTKKREQISFISYHNTLQRERI